MRLVHLTIAVWLTALTLSMGAGGTTNTAIAATTDVQPLRHAISYHRQKTWYYQDRAGIARTPTEHAERRTTSIAFLTWINNTWQERMKRAAKLRKAGLSYTSDWLTAVNIVQRTWPGTRTWLRDTSSGEGGWGPFVMNYQGSGAGGWLQYMPSTFYSHLRSALNDARSRGLPIIPTSAMNWHSPLGQAFAGGWGCHHNPSAWSRPAC